MNIHVLIVDDSIIVRRLLDKALSVDQTIQIVGAVPNGRLALQKLQQVHVDLVLLDIEMPEMNGLETLIQIRKMFPKLPVIMFSQHTKRGAEVTLDALFHGANDYVTKPVAESKEAALQHIRQELIPKIKAFCVTATATSRSKPSLSSTTAATQTTNNYSNIEIVAIGVSTGGPEALAILLSGFSKHFSVPIVIVQHMPPLFTERLAKVLTTHSALSVSEAAPKDILVAGQVWVAPGGYHMVLKREGTNVTIQTHQGPKENSCRPSVDVLFRSIAQIYGAGTLAVILTGMGQDGLEGCRVIKAVGGQVLVQDQSSSVIWSMPGLVAKAGLADKVLPLNQLAHEITYRVARKNSNEHK